MEGVEDIDVEGLVGFIEASVVSGYVRWVLADDLVLMILDL